MRNLFSILPICLVLAGCLRAGAASHEKAGPGPLPAAATARSAEASGSLEGLSYLPFGIDKQTALDKITITLEFFGAKTGAGTQRITLRGDGMARLDFARSVQDKHPKSLEKNCGPATVLRLLDFMESNGVMGMPERIGGEPKGRSQRVLELTLPGQTKRVAVVEDGGFAINEIIGAVKLAAGQCLPEALNHRLFPNL